MTELWYNCIGWLPFDWAHYLFMKNALLAVLFATPLLGLLGTMVVSNRMAFFSDVLGHSALTGIALGVIFGFHDPTGAMVAFMILAAVVVNVFKKATDESFDTVLGVFFAMAVALGIVILSRGGGFSKFTGYLIGDILVVTLAQIQWLAAVFVVTLVYWVFLSNNLVLVSVNPVLARSRGVPVFILQISFSILLAVVVALSIRLVGILIINSLLILPAAASRNITRDMRGYTFWSVIISLFSGLVGLVASYYWGTSSGATIVLFAAAFYVLTAILNWHKKG